MRGQISLDFILAVAIGFFAIGAVIAVSTQIGEMQTEASVRQQLHDIGNGLASVISNSAVLNDSETASVYFDVPYLLVPGEETQQKCSITIGKTCDETEASAICLSYDFFDLETGLSRTIKAEKRYVNPPLMDLPGSVECGERLAITKT